MWVLTFCILESSLPVWLHVTITRELLKILKTEVQPPPTRYCPTTWVTTAGVGKGHIKTDTRDVLYLLFFSRTAFIQHWYNLYLFYYYFLKFNYSCYLILYLSQAYNIVIWHLYTLQCNHHSKSRSHLSLGKFITILLTIFPFNFFLSYILLTVLL